MEDYKTLEGLVPHKKLAFWSVAFSTVAILASVIALPMAYNHLLHLQSMLENEMDFCRVSYWHS